MHAKDKPIAPGVDLDVIARRTPGFTGADLANLMNEAALLSARHDLKLDRAAAARGGDRARDGRSGAQEPGDLRAREARSSRTTRAGTRSSRTRCPNADPVHKISIIPRGRALGYTLTLPMEDKFLVRKSELLDELAMLLGGRTAEELIFSDPTTGAQNDIDRATTIARQMVTEFGMSEALGPLRLGQPQGEVFLGRDFNTTPDYTDEVAARIDAEVRRLVEGAHRVAREILETNRARARRDGVRADRPRDARGRAGAGDLLQPSSRSPAPAWAVRRRPRAIRRPTRRAGAPAPDGLRARRERTDPRRARRRRPPSTGVDKPRIERAVREILEAIGEDPERDGLVRTPAAHRRHVRGDLRRAPRGSVAPSRRSRSRPTTTRW